ncbi:BMP family ABC transporter substrate-binding protein [Clostridium sp. 19966]|uniref:BMP family lipoprotein n=1 Tax=Clostridium sp. 19966 TaxID=2768166 RepID=UPI0028DDDD7A|nr:BMP family ABC transporter substrate-binding protein [Clostridium sp. 19966]MDT8717572.1 BMP family ABC transporter substrate-binding protein [Clostridium sp. 19966]
MNKKKVLAVVAALTIAASLFAGCSKKSDNSGTTSDSTKKSSLKVGLSTDESGINDKSFNQSAHEGLQKAVKDFGVDYKYLESKSADDYQSNLDSLVADGRQLIFGVGYQMADTVGAEADKNKNTKFVIIDSEVKKDNVVSYEFKANESSFLAGVVAAKATKSNKIGFIGGKDGDLINAFEVGFEAGVQSVNPSATVKAIYVNSFGDASLGKTAAEQLINDNYDVIYHAAGQVGMGMFEAVKNANANGKKVWAIGVDMDQSKTAPQYADIILASALKRVDMATYAATKSVIDNTFKGNTVVSLGLKEGGVDLAETHVDSATADLVKKYSDAIKADKIKVPATKAEYKEFKPTTLQ